MTPSTDPSAELVGLLHRLLWQIGEHRRNEARTNGLPVAELAALKAIRDTEQPTPATVASATHLTRSTITGVLDRMEGKGWVTRERSKTDRRKIFLRLTSEGTERAAALTGTLPPPLVDRVASLEAEQRHHLTTLLSQLTE